MSSTSENNKRIAKNTLYLYVRMLLTIAVSLYTGRVVLNVLGVEDYGIYNVVGGVIASFSFLTSTLSGASSRYITYELEKANLERLRLVFNTSFNLHLLLAIVVFLLAESVGLWLLNNKLIIPEDRILAAHIVYQCCIVNTIITITQIPFNADIIAHEKMNVYAYISVIEVLLKLLSIILLQLLNTSDKLILYGGLTVCVGGLINLIYRCYCHKHFKESKYLLKMDKSLFFSMLSFSGWDLYGNMSVVVNSQGKVMLLNAFFGPIINASSGIATQINGVIISFVTNFQMAVRPQIVKKYADNDIGAMIALNNNAAKYSFILIYLISLPVILETHFILNIWLGIVPEYVVSFVRLCLVSSIIWCIFQPVSISIHAIGKMKKISFLTGSMYLLSIILTYLLLKMGFSPNIVFFMDVFSNSVAGVINMYILKNYISQFSTLVFMKDVVLKILLVLCLSFPVPFIVCSFFIEGWLRFIIVGILCIFFICTVSYFIVLGDEAKNIIKKRMSFTFYGSIR